MKKINQYLLIPITLLGICLSSHPSWAVEMADSCNYVIQGSILDVETNQPIPYATVMVQHTTRGTVADEKGKFLLDKLCGLDQTLVFSSIGYKTVVYRHDARHKSPVIQMAVSVSELESIVIEDEAIVGNMQTIAAEKIDKATLDTKITSTLASVVGDIQGVTFTSMGSNVQLPVIHGLYGNRILIVNNGVKHGFQNWGTDHAPEIDISGAHKITVLKGAAGVKYGAEALGGVVVVEGDPLELGKELHGGISTGFQTNGRGYHANANVGKGYENFSYHVGAKYFKIGDRRAPDYNLTNTGMEDLSANVGFRYHLPDWDFKVYYSFVDQNLGLLRGSVAKSGDLFTRALSSPEPIIINDFSYDINEPNQLNTHHLATASVDWHSPLGKLSLLWSQQLNKRQEFDVRRSAELPIIDLELRTSDVRLEWQHPTFIGMEGEIGLQYFSQNNDNNPGTNTTPFIPNYNTQRLSLYAIENFEKGNNTYEFGVRLDHEYNSARGRETNQDIFRNEYDATNVTASIGWVRDLSPHWHLRSNLGSAWRILNMAELYSFGQHGFKIQYGGWRLFFDEGGIFRNQVLTEEDEPLRPESGYKWINELSYKKDGHSLDLTAYSHLIYNFAFDRPLTITTTVRGPAPAFYFTQTDAFFAGADLTYTRRLTKQLEGKLGASYLWSQNIEKNEPLINQPPININAGLSWQTPLFLGLTSSKLSLQTSYTFRQFQAPRTIAPEELISGEVDLSPDTEIFDFQAPPAGYFLANVLWQWEINKFGGQIQVENLLNNSYRNYLNQLRYFADEPGINFQFSINYKL